MKSYSIKGFSVFRLQVVIIFFKTCLTNFAKNNAKRYITTYHDISHVNHQNKPISHTNVNFHKLKKLSGFIPMQKEWYCQYSIDRLADLG